MHIVNGLLRLKDPLSMSLDERRKIFDFRDFFEHDQQELVDAYKSINSDDNVYFKDLFDFNLGVTSQHKFFMDSRMVWDKIGVPEEPVLLNVLLDKTREYGDLRVGTHSISTLKEAVEKDPANQWCQHYLGVLSSLESPCVYILYTDDEMSRRHGFPFDINIELKVPKYYDGSGIAKLLIKCLQEGYNVLDSYQLLKINGEDLALVVENMRNSGHFSEMELDYIESVLWTKSKFDELLDSGGIEEHFSKNHTKRYTEIVFDPSYSTDFSIRSFSSDGLVAANKSEVTEFRFLDETPGILIENLEEHEHQVRFYNKNYMLKYNKPMWIPILLRRGELAYPKILRGP